MAARRHPAKVQRVRTMVVHRQLLSDRQCAMTNMCPTVQPAKNKELAILEKMLLTTITLGLETILVVQLLAMIIWRC